MAALLGSRIWIDGCLVDADLARIGTSDRGFTLGDGLFETMLWTGHQIRFLDDHLARLTKSADALGIALPVPIDVVKAGLAQLTDDTDEQIGAIRLTLTRGTGPRGLALPLEGASALIASIGAFSVPDQPVHLKSVTIARNSGSPSAQFKTLSYIDNIMALDQARKQGGDDAIMLGSTGNVACTSSANLIVRYQGVALTPALKDGALPGIVRGRLLAAGLLEEAHIHPDMLPNCTQSALTNALIGVRPVASINDHRFDIDCQWLEPFKQAIHSTST